MIIIATAGYYVCQCLNIHISGVVTFITIYVYIQLLIYNIFFTSGKIFQLKFNLTCKNTPNDIEPYVYIGFNIIWGIFTDLHSMMCRCVYIQHFRH